MKKLIFCSLMAVPFFFSCEQATNEKTEVNEEKVEQTTEEPKEEAKTPVTQEIKADTLNPSNEMQETSVADSTATKAEDKAPESEQPAE